jgi:solute carrier family 25 carnitine/acylcarnitine transporter 20/29
MCSVAVGHPMDLVKVKIQTLKLAPGEAAPSAISMLTNTMKTEGMAGLYRGVAAPFVAISPIYAICFWGYDIGEKLIRAGTGMLSADGLTMGQVCIAGGFSAIPTTALMAPTERLKILMQASPTGTYKGLVDCGVKTFAEGGVQSLMKGTVATLARDVPGSVAWFGGYEIVKRQVASVQGVEVGELNPLWFMFSGGMAGVFNWLAILPIDTVKSRFQSSKPGEYTGIIDVYKSIVKEGGYGALYRGIGPAMLRAFPANAACFFGVEMAKKQLEKY